LAEIAWLDDGLPSDEKLGRIAARLRGDSGISTGQIIAHMARFREQLAAKAVAEVLSRRFYDSPGNMGLKMKAWPAGGVDPIAHRERAFALQQEHKLMTGSIDRLVIVRSGGKPIAADVIDFKTDEIPPGDKRALAEKVEFYQPQMEAYRGAVGELLGIDAEQIGARLVFLSAGCVQKLERAKG
jgi:ATP-dependent exoDNAse (exonuclease V) beta subunit